MKLDTRVADATLIQSLRPAGVDFARLRPEYGPMLQIVRLLIGVVPNCDPVLAIWPTGFRTYNLIVPNLLNLPKGCRFSPRCPYAQDRCREEEPPLSAPDASGHRWACWYPVGTPEGIAALERNKRSLPLTVAGADVAAGGA